MPEELTELSGTVEDVSVHKEDTGFTVLELGCEDGLVTVVGVMPEIAVGERLAVRGSFSNHSVYGRQFRAQSFTRELPSTAEELYKYLASRTIKGIGPSTAEKIIEKFGERAFDVLENHPEELVRIRGISAEKAKSICEEFSNQFAVRQVLIALERYGMSTRECLRTYKAFGIDSVSLIKENPYLLCGEKIGIGFERADAIAARLPEAPAKKHRLRAGILYTLGHNLGNGHTCLPADRIVPVTAAYLETDRDEVEDILRAMVSDGALKSETISDREFIFLPNIHQAEKKCADRIKVLCAFPPAGRPTLMQDVENIERELCIVYEQKQKQAIITAAEKGVLILTGGPGTGKTTTINGIISLFKKENLRVLLAAPTGRAAKRMSEITGMEAKTVHRLLEVDWDGEDNSKFKRNERNPLKCDALIIDELSMMDILLFQSLLAALPLGCRLIMVGDSDQLPPVGCGNVLHDLIDSGKLPVVELKEVFRQAQRSLIVTNAHRIVSGEPPELTARDGDFFFLRQSSPKDVSYTVCELCSKRLPKAYGFSPFGDIQVLCPSKKGTIGTFNFNAALQTAVNPPSPEKREMTVGLIRFREGDRVMHIRNNYDLEWEKPDGEEGCGIFNGDIGVLREIGSDESALVEFDDGRVCRYPAESLSDLELAYAVTVHKSQGNEFDAVILPLMSITENLAYRNLLYTAVTRAKKILIIVGDEMTVNRMARNNKKSLRYSALRHFLEE